MEKIIKRYIISLILVLVCVSPFIFVFGHQCIDGIEPNLTTLKEKCNITNSKDFFEQRAKNRDFCKEFNDFNSVGGCNPFFYFNWVLFLVMILAHFVFFVTVSFILKDKKTKTEIKRKKFKFKKIKK